MPLATSNSSSTQLLRIIPSLINTGPAPIPISALQTFAPLGKPFDGTDSGGRVELFKAGISYA